MSYIDIQDQGVDPSAPATGFLRLYAKADGLYMKFADGSVIGPVIAIPVNFQFDSELTIASGNISPTGVYHSVDTESDAASDDLTTLTLPTLGSINLVVLRPANDARSIVVKHNAGNIILNSAGDITLDDITDHIMLFYDGTQWVDML